MTQNPSLLQLYTQALATNPLRTKAITSGVLASLQEIIAQQVQKYVSPQIKFRRRLITRAVKMFLYGFLISGPLAHCIYQLFGRFINAIASQFPTLRNRKTIFLLFQVFLANLIVVPIQTLVYVITLSVLNNFKTLGERIRFIKTMYPNFLKTSWRYGPIVQLIVYKYFAVEYWSPLMNLNAFFLGTVLNIRAKLREGSGNNKNV